MGFLDKVKSIKNAVTGGAAKVYIESEDVNFNEPFMVKIQAVIGDATVKIDRVYLKVKGQEEIEVPDVDVMYDEDNNQHRRVETVYASNISINLDIMVTDAQELEANQTYEWEVEVELPEDAPPIFYGLYCQHTYQAFAGLDCFGNDPDSGWQEL